MPRGDIEMIRGGNRKQWVVSIALLTAALLSAGEFLPVMAETNGPGALRTRELDGAWTRGPVALGDVNGDGIDDIVVGGTDGIIHVYTLAGGTWRKLWQYDTGNAVIEAKPAIGDIDGDGQNEVVMGVGITWTPNADGGGVWAFESNGTLKWYYPSNDLDGNGKPDGVFSSPALVDVDGNGTLEIAYGSWDSYIRVLNGNGTLRWQFKTPDTVWPSPAIGDIDRDGKPEIVIGAPLSITGGVGQMYVFNAEDGSVLPGFPVRIEGGSGSSPALGDLDGDGWLDIVVGTSRHPTQKLIHAWDHLGNSLPGWPVAVSAYAFGSPALGDLDGDGDLEVVINTADALVYAFHHDGRLVSGWPSLATTPWGSWETLASPVLADLTGNGYPEVLIPCGWDIIAFDRQGRRLTADTWPPAPGAWQLSTDYGVWGSPAVGDVDGDGRMELVVASGNTGGSKGKLYVWDFDSASTDSYAPWAAFRRGHVNQARYFVPDRLDVAPPWLLIMHEPGSSPSERATIWLTNPGEGAVVWEFSSLPENITPDAISGTISLGGEAVGLTIAVEGYAEGMHDLGAIELVGTLQGRAVQGSPATIPVSLYVGPVERVYFPLVLRR